MAIAQPPVQKTQRQRKIKAGPLHQKAGFRNDSLSAQQRRLDKPNCSTAH
jgi:hypothetical protein